MKSGREKHISLIFRKMDEYIAFSIVELAKSDNFTMEKALCN